MFNTITLGKFFGIPLKLHWSFTLLILYIGYKVIEVGNYFPMWLTLFMFFCVVLHEYGHALMAKYYSIPTEDIVLSPIGGVARLKKIPEEPKHELAIAFAGPLVNLVLCLIFGAYLFFIRNVNLLNSINITGNSWSANDMVKAAFFCNALLFIFNLIPAFPMDGGRILRALLAWKVGRVKATKIATIIGRIIAAIFIFIGIFSQDYIFAILGLFVFITAGAESSEIQKTEKLASENVREFTNRNFTKIHIGDKMNKLIELIKTTGESNFIVYDSLGYIVGTVPTLFIIEAMRKNAGEESVSNWISDKVFSINESNTLKEAFELLNREGLGILTVRNADNEIIGVLDREAISRALAF